MLRPYVSFIGAVQTCVQRALTSLYRIPRVCGGNVKCRIDSFPLKRFPIPEMTFCLFDLMSLSRPLSKAYLRSHRKPLKVIECLSLTYGRLFNGFLTRDNH